MKIDAFANRALHTDTIDLYLVREERPTPDTSLRQLAFVSWMHTAPNMAQAPSLSMDRDSAQRLMDQLWTVGLRPTEGSGSAGSLAATERHLTDMRALAFATIKVPKP